MRKLLISALAVLLLAALAPAGRTEVSGLALARVEVATPAEAAYVASHFDETHNLVSGRVEVLLWPGDAAELQEAGFDYDIVVADVAARDAARFSGPQPLVRLPGPDRKDYRHLVDYNDELAALAKRNPGLVRLLKLPNKTLEGRPVFGVELAKGVRRDDGRPVVYIDGIHHAREWPAAEYPMIFIHYLIENSGKGGRVGDLLERARVIVVPIVNPDGFDYSRESPIQSPTLGGGNGFEGYWRKNRRSFTGVTVPVAQKNPDAYGVDPNRNYSFHWGGENGSSSLPFTQTYRGLGPFSEPEAANVQDIMLSRSVTGIVSNHTYSNLVIRPWGETSKDSPDEPLLARLGGRMARAMGGYRNIKGIELYATTGTTSDYAYGVLGALGYTFEHGTAFHPPYADEVGSSWKGVMTAFLILAEAAADADTHAVVTGRVLGPNGRPVDAEIHVTKKFETPLAEDAVYITETYAEKIDMAFSSG
ncbi:MAG: M14 family metallopeptidase, partial [Actinomycetota bacterium]